jgi:hypothetical protein
MKSLCVFVSLAAVVAFASSLVGCVTDETPDVGDTVLEAEDFADGKADSLNGRFLHVTSSGWPSQISASYSSADLLDLYTASMEDRTATVTKKTSTDVYLKTDFVEIAWNGIADIEISKAGTTYLNPSVDLGQLLLTAEFGDGKFINPTALNCGGRKVFSKHVSFNVRAGTLTDAGGDGKTFNLATCGYRNETNVFPTILSAAIPVRDALGLSGSYHFETKLTTRSY